MRPGPHAGADEGDAGAGAGAAAGATDADTRPTGAHTRPTDAETRATDAETRATGAETRATDAETRPTGAHTRATDALARLDAITRRLRKDCPWDREQDERSIVPHTVEEAYELADAVHKRDDAKLLDELGDVLFQVHFLALLLEERHQGSLAEVAEHCTEKLIRRHPHVFGDAEADTAAQVLHNWERIKQTETGRRPGIFGEVPENLPGPLYARKVQRRVASTGFDFPGVEGPIQAVRDELVELEKAPTEQRRFEELGDLLFAVVNVARKLRLDPELALRAASDRFRSRIEHATRLAASERRNWNDLVPDEQLIYYARARLSEGEGQSQ